MGRGPRSQAETKTAQSLLFGPRRIHSISPLAGKAGQEQVENIIARMQESGNWDEALGLLVRYNDEPHNKNLDYLAEKMSVPIGSSSPDDLADLCAVIDREINRDGNIPALEKLADSIAVAVSNQSYGGDLSQEALNLAAGDHPLGEKVRQYWAHNRPLMVIAYGSGQPPATSASITDDNSFRLRQAVYREAKANPLTLIGDFAGKAVLKDLKEGRPDMEAVIEQIESACINRGGFDPFSPFNIKNRKRAGGQGDLSDYRLGEFLRAMPDQDKIKNMLTAFAQRQYSSPNYGNTITNVRNRLGRRGDFYTVPSLSTDGQKRIDEAARELIDNFAEATIAGNRSKPIDAYKQVVAEEMAAICDPTKLNDQTRLFIDFGGPSDTSGNRPWMRFKNKHLSRSLLPDRKVEVSKQEWAGVIKSSLEPIYGRPFEMELSGPLLTVGLSNIYRSRIEKGGPSDPYA